MLPFLDAQSSRFDALKKAQAFTQSTSKNKYDQFKEDISNIVSQKLDEHLKNVNLLLVCRFTEY